MLNRYVPKRLVLIDIDGLRDDVFRRALAGGQIPRLARLLGGRQARKGLLYSAVSTAPSMTYCCQASSFTGAHPGDHWIAGNHFFDRFGRLTGGAPRKYEFDFVDAPAVFLKGLAGAVLNPEVPTLYETAAAHGLTSTVAYNMYARGAQHWLKPGPEDWRAFVQGGAIRMGQRYDNAMVADVCRHLREGRPPDILTLYFFGLDHESHTAGPAVQGDYLARVIDPQVGKIVDEWAAQGLLPDTLFAIFSDHGQKAVIHDDAHVLKVGFIFDRELGYVFEALGRDVYDHHWEEAHCDALVSPCGGLAHIYVRRRGGAWPEPPDIGRDVLPLAQALWEANATGRYCAELRGSLSAVLLRDVQHAGRYADYWAYTPGGLLPVEEYLAAHPEIETVDAANRLHYMSGPMAGDLLILTNYEEGYNFSILNYRGMHGGLHPEDSLAVLAFGLPSGTPEQVQAVRGTLQEALAGRCRAERGRRVGNVDLCYGLRALMGWA